MTDELPDHYRALDRAVRAMEAARETYRALPMGTATREQEAAFVRSLSAWRDACAEFEVALQLDRAAKKAAGRVGTGAPISAMGGLDELDGK